ncbi:MAG: class II aldolase/adducin family protein [Planctomycetes bacterium]|nr:class II aldolase/adducin family protein [Planctomycetota bacterium]
MTGSKWKASEEVVRRFQHVGRALLLHDIEDSHSGNIAMRWTGEDGEEKILITATGSQKGDLYPSDICLLSTSETDFGYYKASSETDIHARILALDGVGASVHAHTKDLVFVTFDDAPKPNQPAPFIPVDPLGYHVLEGQVPVDWVAVPSGSREMTETIPRRLADHRVTVIQGHGAFAKARTIEEALYRLCIANHAGYVVRLLLKIGADVEGLRAKIREAPAAHFAYPPPDYTVNDDAICEFPEEDELIREFRRAGARIFESRISPFHTGTLSVRGISSMLYAPKASMPREIGGPLRQVPLKPDGADDRELAMHKAMYAAGNFQTVAHCYVPEAETLAHFTHPGETEASDRVIAIDAEGSFLYPVIPVVPPGVELETLTGLLHDYKVVIVRGGGVWGVGHQSLSEVLHHPSSVREICQYRMAAFERGLDLRKLEPAKARRW